MVKPVATRQTSGAWYRYWRLVSLDGSTLDVADTEANVTAFGKPSGRRGPGGFPQVRFVSLVENGTHVLLASEMDGYNRSEQVLGKRVIPHLSAGMLCLADRLFSAYRLWEQASSTGADLLWRVGQMFALAPHQQLPDGSYLSHVYATSDDRRRGRNGILVRVIEYRLDGVADADTQLPLNDYHRGSHPSSCRGISGCISRTLGDRNRTGRIKDTSARLQNHFAKQNA